MPVKAFQGLQFFLCTNCQTSYLFYVPQVLVLCGSPALASRPRCHGGLGQGTKTQVQGTGRLAEGRCWSFQPFLSPWTLPSVYSSLTSFSLSDPLFSPGFCLETVLLKFWLSLHRIPMDRLPWWGLPSHLCSRWASGRVSPAPSLPPRGTKRRKEREGTFSSSVPSALILVESTTQSDVVWPC